ncbi:uncharacterized protein LOC121779536 [Salvia splendens]|uniref:uncharacterized protein LOC121779536 n=1 Tax=Salvia splendens TaxID=180675 RepID=UPI001C261F5D|nr:uncharacterized protein LOC121779536 [Salvia splendens]
MNFQEKQQPPAASRRDGGGGPTGANASASERGAATALPSLRRAFSLYDQINIITQVPEDQLRFQEFDDTGFKVNGVRYEGSILCVGNLLMSWTPKKFSDITAESLSIFKTLPGKKSSYILLNCKQPTSYLD